MVGREKIIYNNFSPQEIIDISKLQIHLLSRYLMETFEVINSILIQSEKMVIKFLKIINPNSNLNTKDTSNTNSLNSEFEEKNDLLDYFADMYKKNKIGKYHWKIRAMKIIKYKIKNIIRQKKKPIITKYYGRSKIASEKPRFHGKFIKKKNS